LVHRVHRAEAHRHGGELPELGHEPRMRGRRQPLAAHDLSAEVVELRFAEAPFEECARVDARRRVALEEHLVARAAFRILAAEEMSVDDLLQYTSTHIC